MTENMRSATNMSIRAAVDSMKEIVGDIGEKIIFINAGLRDYFDHPPEYNWDPCVSVDRQTLLFCEVEKLIGINGAIDIWRRIGYRGIQYAHEIGGPLRPFEGFTPEEKYLKGVEIFALATGKGRVVQNGNGVDFDGYDCVMCEPYRVGKSICSVYTGILQYVADWAYGKDVQCVTETRCRAKGDDTCYYQLV